MVSELRALTKPVKIIAIAFTLLLALTAFFGGNFFDRMTSSNLDAQAAIAKLQKDKLDVAAFERQCDITRAEIDKKADREKVDIVQRRLDQIIGIMLDPTKTEAVRAEIRREKSIR